MKKLWFKRKLYGWGWTPTSWQGWVVILLYMIIAIGVPLAAALFFDAENNPEQEWLVATVAILLPIILVIPLVWIGYKKGEKPTWQWGERVGDEEDDSQKKK